MTFLLFIPAAIGTMVLFMAACDKESVPNEWRWGFFVLVTLIFNFHWAVARIVDAIEEKHKLTL